MPRQLTDDELSLFHYTIDLTNWLDPFHNFLRLRGDNAKQTSKTNHSSNGGASSNGHGRKVDDPPRITDPPDSILSYFKSEWSYLFFFFLQINVAADAHAKFMRTVEESRPIYEILHIAALAQEASELRSI
jgi:hypothetical protein